jgi:hypothetical protein
VTFFTVAWRGVLNTRQLEHQAEQLVLQGKQLDHQASQIDLQTKQFERVRPANTFRELSHPGDDLALVPALMLGLDRDLRGWHGSHGDYFRH